MSTIQIKLEPGRCYHLFNRGNSRENIFILLDNYRYFPQKYIHDLSSYLDTNAYCLMPNHFHFLVKIKDERDFTHHGSSSSDFSRRFFMAYSKAVNKQAERAGSLFSRNIFAVN